MYQNNCKKCGSSYLFTKSSGNNTGLYCSDCGSWIKWLNKNELRAFEESNKQKEDIKLTKLKPEKNEFVLMRYPFGIHTQSEIHSIFEVVNQTFNNNACLALPDDLSLKCITKENLYAIKDIIDEILEES